MQAGWHETVGSALAGRPEAADAAVGSLKAVDTAEGRLHHGHDDQLRDALEGLDREFGLAAVPAADHQLALVVAVDQPDEVAQHDAVLVAQARARQDQRGQAGVGDMDGQARRDQRRLARRQRDRGVEAGAQVQAGAAGRGVGGDLLGHAGVEHLQVNRVHQSLLAMSATSSRARLSLSARGSSRWPCSSISRSALSSRPKVAGPRLATMSGIPLRRRLASACSASFSLSAAKPTQ
mmetsp:Transcript_24152/g.58678  ORF Transcript_24152/g.58678 Transcript_24152/m.58678 type:complete len:236 (-) Transcript_24152:173-880(-)